MSESAEAAAANASSRRNVTIEITNLTTNYCLINPKAYLENGSTYNPPQPTVRPLKTEVCTFSKDSGRASGAVGVMTYDFFHKDRHDFIETLAIMFSVPYDRNMYKNWFALGIYKKGKECNEALFKEMYYDKEPKGFVRAQANGSDLTFEGSYLDVKATMCPLGRAIMKVEIWEKLFSAPMSQHHH